jgi:hypothetical protein
MSINQFAGAAVAAADAAGQTCVLAAAAASEPQLLLPVKDVGSLLVLAAEVGCGASLIAAGLHQQCLVMAGRAQPSWLRTPAAQDASTGRPVAQHQQRLSI